MDGGQCPELDRLALCPLEYNGGHYPAQQLRPSPGLRLDMSLIRLANGYAGQIRQPMKKTDPNEVAAAERLYF
jgi:hypothetical protein